MTTESTHLAESTIRWLEDVEPGLELAGWLMAYSDVRMSGYDRIVVLRDRRQVRELRGDEISTGAIVRAITEEGKTA